MIAVAFRGNIYGSNVENEDAAKKGKLFVAGDRVGLRLDCNDGSLRFYRNGEPFGDQFLDSGHFTNLLEVPTIYHGYFSGLGKGKYAKNMALLSHYTRPI
jgi:hypothetical protein